jgi:hypothetical protein
VQVPWQAQQRETAIDYVAEAKTCDRPPSPPAPAKTREIDGKHLAGLIRHRQAFLHTSMFPEFRKRESSLFESDLEPWTLER